MPIKGLVKSGEYYDSVTLMRVAKKLTESPGVEDAAVVMATPENISILSTAGLLVAEFKAARDQDLLIAVRARAGETLEQVLAQAEAELKSSRAPAEEGEGAEVMPRSLEGAVRALPGANLALISVAGRYAGEEARKALEQGLHVMLFSDNVPLAQEIALKRYAREKGLLVMGPDCGTAIVNGKPLGFANVVTRGPIGIVAAAGTGLQEVSTLISNQGEGISQALGTGGRDVKKEVGGIMFLEGLKALAADPETRVIVLVSKPPYPEVLDRIASAVRKVKQPVVAVFLGADVGVLARAGMHPAATLEEAALLAVEISRGGDPAAVKTLLAERDARIRELTSKIVGKAPSGSGYLRGLFSGGTFCYECQLILRDLIGPVASNTPLASEQRLADAWESVGHTVVDLGDDEFTKGRPHPMIDYSLRKRRLEEELQDPKAAVILLDVVLGYGSHPDPVAELGPLLSRAKKPVICSVTGTDHDPQQRNRVERGLRETGAVVMTSNAAACRLAGEVVRRLARKEEPMPKKAAVCRKTGKKRERACSSTQVRKWHGATKKHACENPSRKK